MKKPEWFKHLEEHSPQKLLNVTSKLENHLEDLSKNTKHAIEVLDEKASIGKGIYVTILFPFIGDNAYLPKREDLSRKEKAINYGVILGMGAARAGGLAYSAITGDIMPGITVYGGLTFGEELAACVGNWASKLEFKEPIKNNLIKTS